MDESSREKFRPVGTISAIRRIFPQILAATAQSFHSIDTGLVLAMPTIVIPALIGIRNEHNRDEFLNMTTEQASWIGGIEYLFLPFGSLAAGVVTDLWGRKWSTILMNIPFVIGWLMLYQANHVWQIFVAFALLGFAIGLTVQCSVYFGEICEPFVRGTLIGYANILGTMGGFLAFILNTLVPWRIVALICFAVPVISTISLCFVPETPQWLLSQNREEDAEKSLRWLRGWVPQQTVSQEFQQLKRQSEHSNSCDSCKQQNLECPHPPPLLREKIFELKEKRTLKPLLILIALFFLNQFTGVYAMRPFIVQIFEAYKSPVSSDKATAIMSFIDSLANVVFMCSIHFTGKRGLYLTAATGAFLSSLVITCYGFYVLPSGYTSFGQAHQILQFNNKDLAWIPMICLILWSFFSYCSFMNMPWTIITEIFSFRSRVVATTIATIINALFAFISKKIYYGLEGTLSLPGISLFFCVICGAGLVLMYFILPETEGRTLEEIEIHFSDNSKKITDWKIVKSSNRSEKE